MAEVVRLQETEQSKQLLQFISRYDQPQARFRVFSKSWSVDLLGRARIASYWKVDYEGGRSILYPLFSSS